MYIHTNLNPQNKMVGDCVVRAIAKAMDKEWEMVYLELTMLGLEMADMPSSNEVWGTYLLNHNFSRFAIPNFCPACYTVEEFCMDNTKGTFVLGTGTHALAVINGNYYDTWESGYEVPMYCFRKER